MASVNDAVKNRSLRVVKSELEFLYEAGVITPVQYTEILRSLPEVRPLMPAPCAAVSSTPLPIQSVSQPPSQPTPQPAQPALDEKRNNGYYATPTPTEQQGPPAYNSAPPAPTGPPVLAHATALYVYSAQDVGDLALMPNDRIGITEYMNAEWWRGKNERTGKEGIFPRSYVRADEKSLVSTGPQPSNYGNMELDVANGVGSDKQPGKGEEHAKKFGKKLGNAAIFGAGTTIGGKIVNGIF